jgi:hypothetical protein
LAWGLRLPGSREALLKQVNLNRNVLFRDEKQDNKDAGTLQMGFFDHTGFWAKQLCLTNPFN